MSDYSQSAASDDAQFKDELSLARECLSRLSPARADDRDSWIKVGMALQSVSDELLQDWITFSGHSEKFKAGECEKVWKGFRPDKARSLGLGSLIKWAREDSGDPNFGKPASASQGDRIFATLDDAIAYVEWQASGGQAGLWGYSLPDGRPWFWIVRIDLPGLDKQGKRNKTFRPIHREGHQFEIGDPPGKLPLYRLLDLAKGKPVDLVEGEKTAEVAAELGLNPTTSAHGASSSAKTDWTPLAGQLVRIFPDEDPDGIKYALAVGKQLEALEPPATVTVVELPGLPDRGDLADFVEQRRASGKSDPAIKAEIDAAIASATTLASYAGTHQGAIPEFQDPSPLPDELPSVLPFDFDLLPVRLAPWARDIAERMQCAADFIFAASMVALSAILGRKVGIRPKRFDSWLVVANLWGAVVGRPGILKTPAVQEAFKPLHRLELEAKETFERDKKASRAAQLMADARRRMREKDLHSAVKKGGGEDIAKEMAADEPSEPVRRRYVLNDSTVEKLGEILNQNPNGVLSYRDELFGLLRSLEKEGQEGARGFYLQAWNGDSSYVYDRIGRGTVDIEAAILSVFGSIQPGPLARYLLSGATTGQSDDGLIQRFQVLVWPDPPKAWMNHDREPDRAARGEAYAVFKALDELTWESAGAERDPGDIEAIPFLRYSEEAQAEFDAWRARWELRLRAGEEDEAFESHLAKYRSLIPSLSLLYHLVDVGHGAVGLASLRRALRTAEYLESHARRVYSATISADMVAAYALARKILARKITSPFVLRDVYQHGWTRLKNAEDVGKAVALLVEHNWLVSETTKREKGAPKTSYNINPKIWDFPSGGPGKTGRSANRGREHAGDSQARTGTTGTSQNEDDELHDDGARATGRTCTSSQEGGLENHDDSQDATGITGRSNSEAIPPVVQVPDQGPATNSVQPDHRLGVDQAPIVDLVRESFDGVEVSDLRSDANGPASPPPSPRPPPPAAASPDRSASQRKSATAGLAFEGMDTPEVPYD